MRKQRWIQIGVAGLMLGGWLARRRYHWMAWVLGLPAPKYLVRVERDVAIVSGEGIRLMTDHYAPQNIDNAPTILIRSPYGRYWKQGSFGVLLEFCARRFAEHGYHVIVQDVRGRFDSDSDFDPFIHERADGLATIAWLRQQNWFNGRLGTWGASYLGMTQWAIANGVPELKAMMPIFTSTRLRHIILPEEALDIGLIMRWMAIFYTLDKYRSTVWRYSPWVALEVEQRARLTFDQHSIDSEDQHLTGERVPFYQNWLAHLDEDDPLWHSIDHTVDVNQVNTAVHMIAGWHDFFLKPMLLDYEQLVQHAPATRLTIGPWQHFNNANGLWVGLQEGLSWFDTYLKSDTTAVSNTKPVHVYINGKQQWQDFDAYPPATNAKKFYLASHDLTTQQASQAAPDIHLIFDPQNPPPFIGGAQFSFDVQSYKHQQPIAQRPDTYTLTSTPLEQAITIIGKSTLRLQLSSADETCAITVRLCTVRPDGKVMNICDGYAYFKGSIRPQMIDVELWDTAYYFEQGERIQIILAGGAYPHWVDHADWHDHALGLRKITLHATPENTLNLPVLV